MSIEWAKHVATELLVIRMVRPFAAKSVAILKKCFYIALIRCRRMYSVNSSHFASSSGAVNCSICTFVVCHHNLGVKCVTANLRRTIALVQSLTLPTLKLKVVQKISQCGAILGMCKPRKI